MNEVEHMGERVTRLGKSIVEVIQLASSSIREVVRGLQALRGIAHISAVTIAVELGNITSCFEGARNLMGYSGAFPSEDSSGKRIRRGGITKSGNAHLRHIVVESAWSYRHLPRVGAKLRKRQQGLPAEITEIAWKAQNRLHKRYMTLRRRHKTPRYLETRVKPPNHGCESRVEIFARQEMVLQLGSCNSVRSRVPRVRLALTLALLVSRSVLYHRAVIWQVYTGSPAHCRSVHSR
jgi:Transposase IS116/IS110/IS902 family